MPSIKSSIRSLRGARRRHARRPKKALEHFHLKLGDDASLSVVQRLMGCCYIYATPADDNNSLIFLVCNEFKKTNFTKGYEEGYGGV